MCSEFSDTVLWNTDTKMYPKWFAVLCFVISSVSLVLLFVQIIQSWFCIDINYMYTCIHFCRSTIIPSTTAAFTKSSSKSYNSEQIEHFPEIFCLICEGYHSNLVLTILNGYLFCICVYADRIRNFRIYNNSKWSSLIRKQWPMDYKTNN